SMEKLKQYRGKRNFQRTPEPTGETPREASAGGGLFVIHKHAAQRLHFDLRLEQDGARTRPMAKALRPQLATLVQEVPKGAGWIHEIKFDGYRIIAQIDDGEVHLVSRNGQDWTDRFPELA